MRFKYCCDCYIYRPQVVWWLQTKQKWDTAQALIRLIGQYHINGNDLVNMKSSQPMKKLLKLKYYHKISKQHIIELLPTNKKQLSQSKIIQMFKRCPTLTYVKSEQIINEFPEIRDLLNDEQTRLNNISADIISEAKNLNICIKFRYKYEKIWNRIIELKNNNNNTNASLIVDIVQGLRMRTVGDSIDREVWDAVFFNEIDNYLATLLLFEHNNTNQTFFCNLKSQHSIRNALSNKRKSMQYLIESKDNLDDIATQLRNECKTYKYCFGTYYNCLNGIDTVNAIIEIDPAISTRKQAVALTSQLLDQNINLMQVYEPYRKQCQCGRSSSHNIVSTFSTICCFCCHSLCFRNIISTFYDRKDCFFIFPQSIHDDASNNDENDDVLHPKHPKLQFRDCPCKKFHFKKCLNWFYLFLLFTIIGLVSFLVWWLNDRANFEMDTAMEWTVSSVEAHLKTQVEYKFSVPQYLLSILIAGLFTNDIPLDNTILNGSYDNYFASFAQYDAASDVYGWSLYNENENILMAIGRDINDLDSLYITVVNDSSCWEYDYGTTNVSDNYIDKIEKLYCPTYSATQEPWYINDAQSDPIWTEPYNLQTLRGTFYVITLSQAVTYKNVHFVFVVALVLDSVQDVVDTMIVPLGGVLYLSTHNFSIIGSTVSDLNIEQCNNRSLGLPCVCCLFV